MSHLLLANASAGAAQRDQVEEAHRALGRSKVELVWSEDPDDLDPIIERLDGRTLVCAGGDGSLHVVVQRLWDRGELEQVVVALIPLGTGNDLARGLGIPLEPAAAATLALTGTPRLLDLGVDEAGTVVVNAVHAGLGAEAALKAEDLKETLGPLAYPLGAAIAAARPGGWSLTVTVDGERLVPEDPGEGMLMVGICNGPSIGGGTPLCPPARPDDGRLDVVVVAATGAAARLAFGAALREGEHLDRPDVAHRTGREVRIEGDSVRHDVDGEVSEEVGERAYRIVPEAWRLIR